MTFLSFTRRIGFFYLFLICAVFSFSTATLLRHGPEVERISLVPVIKIGQPNTAIPLPSEPIVDGFRYTANFELHEDRIPSAIELLLATSGSSPEILRARLYNGSRECVWKGPHGWKMEDNARVRFQLDHCPLQSLENLQLELDLNQKIGLHIWTIHPQDAFPRTREQLSPYGMDRAFVHGILEFSTGRQSPNRLTLLAAMWDEQNPQLLLAGLTLGLLAFGLGLWAIIRGGLSAWKIAFVWMGLTINYAIICPPLQAPDEPDHLLTYAMVNRDTKFADDLLTLANKGHFERIKFHPDEKFTAISAASPQKLPWADHVGVTDLNSRSPLTLKIWTTLGTLLSFTSAPLRIFLLRCFDSLYVLTFLLLAFLVDRKRNPLTDLPFFILLATIPTLIFFSMHVSNYFTAIALYLAGGLIICRWLSRSEIRYGDLLILGVCAALGPFTNASGSALILVWAITLAIAAFTEQSDIILSKKRKIFECILILVPVLLAQILFNGSRFISLLTNFPQIFTPKSSDWIGEFAGNISTISLFLPLTLLARRKLNLSKQSKQDAAKFIIRIVNGTLVAAFVIYYYMQTMSPVFRTQLRDIEISPTLHPFKHAFANVLLYWVNLLPSEPEFYMSSSFWSGFGWLDSIMPPLAINFIKAFTSLGLIAGIWRIIWQNSLPRSLRGWGVFYAMNLLLYGMAYKLGRDSINLHGRYIIFCFILAISIAASGYRSIIDKLPIGDGTILKNIGFIASTSIVLIHLYTFQFILLRYF